MSMHIEGPWLSSISTKARAEKITKAQREELERNWRDRNKRLKEMGLPKQSFEEFLDFVHGRKTQKKTNTSVREIQGSTWIRTNSTRGKKNQTKIADTFKPSIPDLSYRTQTKRVVSTVNVSASETGAGLENITIENVPLKITRPEIWVTGPTSSKQTPAYTGTKIVGIGTMHKSNLVPIFSDQEAEDISKMRR